MQVITKLSNADFDDNSETIAVTVTNNNQTETFYIQTANGRYKTGLGCLIFTDNNGDVDIADYGMFEFEEIIATAEEFLK